jgi:hypothetical protein
MGQWTVVIQGHGIHDNGRNDDADRMVTQFVKDLLEKGHVISSVSFTVGMNRELAGNSDQ